ncbi:hypothetical protein A2U01_0025202 [Trifolium medium]|uniref:Uncharacterized protein n=1 Tax=Trifolium medium TaxID=97028 RepID=A0A392NWF1_9FABA|nr:hypothetical protein [Trifolium medium]
MPTGGYFAPINILLRRVHRRQRSWQKSRLRCVDVHIIGGFGGTTVIHMQDGNHSSLPFCGVLNRNIETSCPYPMKKRSAKWNQSR